MEKLSPTLRNTQDLIKKNIHNDLHNLEEIREKIEDIVSFFSETDPHQGAQLYFEMRIDNMLAPFVNLFRFIDQLEIESEIITNKIKDYLSSNPSLLLDGLFQILKKALPNQEIELERIHGQMIHFSILIREFTFLYGTSADYLNEFGTYTFRDNIVDFYKKGNLIASNLIHFLATQSLSKTPIDVETSADFYLRKTIFKSYHLSLSTNNEQCLQEYQIAYAITKNKITQLKTLAVQAIPILTKLSQTDLDNKPLAQKLRNYYQIQVLSDHPDLDELNSITNHTKQRSIGFELEFNSGGASTQSVEDLAKKYQNLLNWNNLYSAPHEDMYKRDSDGLLYRDLTLPQRYDPQNNIIGRPLEYSSPPFTYFKDKDKYTSFLNMIKEEEDTILYTNSECHQHIYAKDIDLEGLKRLVLRRAWHDQAILEAFHVSGKTHDFNRSASALLTNISSQNTEQERKRNFIIFAGLVNSANDIAVLTQRTNRGNCKYNSLNLLPKETVEFRGMQGTFDKDFLEYYLKFNLFFVESAIQNYSIHFLPHALEKAHELRSKDSSPVLYVKRMSYHKEAFDPTIYLSQKEQQYLLNHDAHIVAEIIKTQAFPLPNFLKEGYHRIDNDISLN